MLSRREITQFIGDKFTEIHFKIEKKHNSEGESTWNVYVKEAYKPFESLEDLKKLLEEN